MPFSFLQAAPYIFGMPNVKVSAPKLSLIDHILSTNFDAHIHLRISQLIQLSTITYHKKVNNKIKQNEQKQKNKGKKFFQEQNQK